MFTAKEARDVRDNSETVKNTKEFFQQVIEKIEAAIKFAASKGESEYFIAPGLDIYKMLHPVNMDVNEAMLQKMVNQELTKAGYTIDKRCGNDYREHLVISWKESDIQ